MNTVQTSTKAQFKLAVPLMNPIPVRHMQFEFKENFPKNFAFDNACASAMFAVMSAIFPDGERFFVNSIRRFRDDITDGDLKEQVKGFIGQESMHGREHDRLNMVLAAHGYDLKTPERNIKFALRLLEKLTPAQQLACTVLMEHTTAHLAIQWLTHKQFNETADQASLAIWQWHALEELEHKSVSFDVYKATTSDQKIDRLIAVVATSATVLPAALAAWGVVAYKMGCLKDIPSTLKGINLLFGRKGFLLPIMTKLPDFLMRDFDPRNDETYELEQEWTERLLGKTGAINHFYTNKKQKMTAHA